MLSSESVVKAVSTQVSCALDSEVVVLDLAGGIYYGLNSVGARVWALIQEPVTVRDLCDRLLEEFEVEPERCLGEVLALLEQLLQHGLVEANGRQPATAAAS